MRQVRWTRDSARALLVANSPRARRSHVAWALTTVRSSTLRAELTGTVALATVLGYVAEVASLARSRAIAATTRTRVTHVTAWSTGHVITSFRWSCRNGRSLLRMLVTTPLSFGM